MSKGFFGDLFDLNHDGVLDSVESTTDYMLFEEMINETEGADEDEDDDDF